MFTAEKISADEALSCGLVQKLVKEEDLELFVDNYASTISKNAPLTIKAMKQIGIEISKNSDITHVISDLLMPDTNGVEFIKKVKTLNNSVKCYIHSGVNITDEIREALSKKLIDDLN